MKPINDLILRIALTCGSIAFGGCAHVTFHPALVGKDLPDTTVQTGIKYYNSKPYLLVSYTGNKDAPVKVDVISLPELDHPVYAMYHAGLGSHQFTVTLGANGTLASYGQTADSKIPETLTAVGSMVSSLATGLKTAGIFNQSALEDPAISALVEAIGQLQIITTGMDQKNPVVMTVFKQTVQLQSALNDIIVSLKTGSRGQKEALGKAKEEIKALVISDAAGTPDAVAINKRFDNAQQAVQKAIEALDKPAAGGGPVTPDFRLYDIRFENNVLTLVPIEVSKP